MQKQNPLPAVNERALVLLVGMVQFVNILDFMMVMPLGPDFARALGIPVGDIGEIGGAYTFAAALSGLIAALFLDQYARKSALLVFLSGLICATLSGALVWSSASMITARLLAGMCGGPLSALSISLIADYIPPERRGSAMGKVMGGFAIASVFGVPFGLELAQHISWRAPFVTTALIGFGVAAYAWRKLPYHKPYRKLEPLAARALDLARIFRWRLALMSYAILGFSMLGNFMIVPNISAHVQMNLGYPRDHLGLLYFCGGGISFFTLRLAGKLIDRTSATLTISLFTATLVAAIAAGYIWFGPTTPVLALFILFMVSSSGRMVSAQTLSSEVPAPGQRGAYMAVQSSVTQLAAATGAYISSLILTEQGGKLLHMPTVGMASACISLLVPFFCWRVERKVKCTRGKAALVPPLALVD
jgi:predicted MFS family arabinose efflux permease